MGDASKVPQVLLSRIMSAPSTPPAIGKAVDAWDLDVAHGVTDFYDAPTRASSLAGLMGPSLWWRAHDQAARASDYSRPLTAQELELQEFSKRFNPDYQYEPIFREHLRKAGEERKGEIESDARKFINGSVMPGATPVPLFMRYR